MANADNIKIGACQVFFKGRDLGHTKGGVTINYAPENVMISADQWGETPIDYSGNGELWTITVRLTESAVQNIKDAMPHGTLEASDARLALGRNAGHRLSEEAGLLVLHPLANDPTDASEDVVFYKAVAMDEFEMEFTNEDQRVFEVPFVALVDTTKTDGNWLGHIGDSGL
jgi:hypothetical protein